MKKKGRLLSIILALTLVLSAFVPMRTEAASNCSICKKNLTKIVTEMHKLENVVKKGYNFPGSSTAKKNSLMKSAQIVKNGYYDDDDDYDDYDWDNDWDDYDDEDYDDDDYWDDYDDDDDYWDDYDDDEDDWWDEDEDEDWLYDDDEDDDDYEDDVDYSGMVKAYAKYIGVSSSNVYDAMDAHDTEESDIVAIYADRYASMCFAALCYDAKTGVFNKISNACGKVDKTYPKCKKTAGLKNYYNAVLKYMKVMANVDATKYQKNPKKFLNDMKKAYNKANKMKKKA